MTFGDQKENIQSINTSIPQRSAYQISNGSSRKGQSNSKRLQYPPSSNKKSMYSNDEHPVVREGKISKVQSDNSLELTKSGGVNSFNSG